MSEEAAFTGYTVSFKPGGTGYDSPLVVVRASSLTELLDKLNVDGPNEDLAAAVYEFDQELREAYVGSAKSVTIPVHDVLPTGTPPPIWATSASPFTAATPGGITFSEDGTYSCPHNKGKAKKVWTSPRNGRRYAFCSLDKGAAGACETVTV